jgi:hypothetical protein
LFSSIFIRIYPFMGGFIAIIPKRLTLYIG